MKMLQNGKKAVKKFVGEGRDFDSALEIAIKKTDSVLKAPDDVVVWKLIEVSGECGGFLPRSVFRVTIEVSD